MGMGFLGAMGGLGDSLQSQGKAWADELKEKRILESKDKYARELKKEDQEFQSERDRKSREHDVAIEDKRGERETNLEAARAKRDIEKEKERGKQDRETARERAGLGLGTGSQESSARRAQAILDARDQYREETKYMDEGEDKPSFEDWLNDNGMGDLLQPTERPSLGGSRRNPGVAKPGSSGAEAEAADQPVRKPITIDSMDKQQTQRTLDGLRAALLKGHSPEDLRAEALAKGMPESDFDLLLEMVGAVPGAYQGEEHPRASFRTQDPGAEPPPPERFGRNR